MFGWLFKAKEESLIVDPSLDPIDFRDEITKDKALGDARNGTFDINEFNNDSYIKWYSVGLNYSDEDIKDGLHEFQVIEHEDYDYCRGIKAAESMFVTPREFKNMNYTYGYIEGKKFNKMNICATLGF